MFARVQQMQFARAEFTPPFSTLGPHPSTFNAFSGFTLVEMLVATGLTMLIMMMFAQIYGTAIGTMTEQRGMANNDQKARTLSTVLRSDLQNMTYRQAAFPYGTVQGIVPIVPGDEPIVDPVNQRGYFYISENDPNTSSDDVLQFTVMLRAGRRGDTTTSLSQRKYIGRAANLSVSNEPEQDDGIDGDSLSQSRAAEICYFLRGGNLYRRVLLLRDPLLAIPQRDPQPTANSTNAPLYSPTAGRNYGGTNFYSDFDFSATRFYDDTTSGTSFLWFNSISSLQNELGNTNNPVALPWNRFGFFNYPPDTADNGMPREYLDYTDPSTFIGRFTQGDTSDNSFGWPGTQNTALDRSVASSGYSGGDRQGEDILLTNVESFDVQVYDQGYVGFVNLGDGNGTYFGATSNGAYGPRSLAVTGVNNQVFDTWHPSISVASSASRVPYHPTLIPASSFGTWSGGGSYLQVPALTGSDRGSPAPTYYNTSLLYQKVTTAGTSATIQPEFPPVPGTIVQDNTNRWVCVDNRVGLEAIQIVVRYRDVSSNLVRQVTLVHSFVE